MLNSSRWRHAAFALLIAMIALHLILSWIVRREALSGSCDFSIFYTAGQMLRRGDAHILYDSDAQLAIQREFVKESFIRKGPLPYNHPPFEALLYWPLAYLPYAYAYFIALALNLAVLTAGIYILRPWLPNISERFPILLFLVPLAFFPMFYSLIQGQDSIFLWALYCLAYSQFRQKRELIAGLLLGLGLFKFHLILPFAFVLLLCGYWRSLLGMAISASVEFVVSLKIVGWSELLYYPRFIWTINRQLHRGVIVPENMPNLRGLLTGWPILSPPPHWLEAALLLFSLGVLIWAAYRWNPRKTLGIAAWNMGFSLALIATFLVGYHSYTYDMSFVLLAILLVIDFLLGLEADGPKYLWVALSLLFFSPLQLVLMLRFSHQNLFALVVLAFAACVASACAAANRSELEHRSTGSSPAQLQ